MLLLLCLLLRLLRLLWLLLLCLLWVLSLLLRGSLNDAEREFDGERLAEVDEAGQAGRGQANQEEHRHGHARLHAANHSSGRAVTRPSAAASR